ncbi:phage virion morphogenesis protein [Alteromonadaceae bacterium 2753L.S.0a.02]|nr:phage virion morphogenesis protein [Alteromonadaceae bacterium 2753L.S.0a.02]
MSNYDSLATWADPLLHKLTPQQRRQFLKRLAIALRRRNQQRIAKQQTPNGSPFAPRKNKTTRPRAMFAKLKQARHIKVRSASTSATLEIIGRAGRIAAVHHFGLTDYVEEQPGPSTKYPARPLLGFSSEDETFINDFFLTNLKL